MLERHLLYSDLAEWWPLLSAPEEYEEEAAFYSRTLIESCATRPKDVLELGSGGGNNASHMKRDFTLTLVDLSPDMLAVSEQLNPECAHLQGDMRTVRVGREFDAVFVHDAIDYMTTLDDLAAAVQTALIHTKPGGVALFCPDHLKEHFKPSTEHGGEDGGGRALRYLMWTWDPDPTDSSCVANFAYMLREGEGEVRVLEERHICGLFSEQEWMDVFRSAGFEPTIVPFVLSDVPEPLHVVLGVKPSG
jgi:trans-aconitate methyltransferase